MKLRVYTFALFLVISSAIFLACNTNNAQEVTVSTEELSEDDFSEKLTHLIKDSIHSLKPNKIDSIQFSDWKHSILAAYETVDYQPIWVNKSILNKNGNDFYNFLNEAEFHALLKEQYDFNKIKTLKDSLEKSLPSLNFVLLKQLDMALTKAFLKVALHIDKGLYDEKKNKINNNFWSTEEQYSEMIKRISKDELPTQLLASLEPQHPIYQRFKNAIQLFVSKNNINSKKITIRDYKKDSIGAINDARVALVYFHYLHDTLKNDNEAYLSALKQFQQDQGYNPDGIIGSMTAKALERDNSEKFKLLVINADRWRRDKANYKTDKRYVWVNLPSFKLRVIENDKVLMEKNVVIGKAGGKTKSPNIISAINRIVLWPTWSVPQSIIKNEMKSFAGYIVTKNGNYTSVVQPPGPRNSLGVVKILFPNSHSVYIHDTPTKYLFKSDYRAHSHGCIRCQDPLEVAALLMSMDTFKLDYDSLVRLKEAKIQTKNFNFKTPIPVYIQYFTAGANWNNELKFYADVYKKDEKMLETIFGISKVNIKTDQPSNAELNATVIQKKDTAKINDVPKIDSTETNHQTENQ